MRTSALGRINVRMRPIAPAGPERDMLADAERYRSALVALQQERHERTIDLRNEHFPALYAAMVDREREAFVIFDLEKKIKAHHSEVRDRNAVPPELRKALEIARARHADATRRYAAESRPYKLMFRAHAKWWATLADWQNVKSRDKRREKYAAVEWPTDAAAYSAALTAAKIEHDPADLRREATVAYGRFLVEWDARKRDLDEEFAALVHSATRAEINEACQPKLSKDGPGTRYRYGRPPEERPWEKLSVHFPGGLTVADALSGKSNQLRLTQYGPSLYGVTQQIGTRHNPAVIRYTVAHTELPPDAQINRWSYVVRRRRQEHDGYTWRRYAVPVCAGLPDRPTGTANVVAYKLSWTRTKLGVLVATFWGSDGYYERLIIPEWVVARVENVATEQSACDEQANAILAEHGMTPEPGKKQGMEALAEAGVAPDELANLQRRMQAAGNDARKARGCIEEIYKVTAARLRKRYAAVCHDDIKLAKLVRYDTRDLLKPDPIPLKSRTIRQAVSPGKLRLWLKQSGLPASGEAPPQPPDGTREHDYVMSYVWALGIKTGRREGANDRRSQSRVAALAMS